MATRWALISVERGGERTRLALDIVAQLLARGRRVGGFSQSHGDHEGRSALFLDRLGTDERALLAVAGVVAKGATQESFCDYVFRAEAFAAANRWLRVDGAKAEVLLLDSISKLETAGKGHAATLAWALQDSGAGVVIICARASQLAGIVEAFGLEEDRLVAALEEPVAATAIAGFVDAVMSARVR